MPAYLMSVFHPAADADPADMQERYPQAVTQLVDKPNLGVHVRLPKSIFAGRN